jgi:hypothetical protein
MGDGAKYVPPLCKMGDCDHASLDTCVCELSNANPGLADALRASEDKRLHAVRERDRARDQLRDVRLLARSQRGRIRRLLAAKGIRANGRT